MSDLTALILNNLPRIAGAAPPAVAQASVFDINTGNPPLSRAFGSAVSSGSLLVGWISHDTQDISAASMSDDKNGAWTAIPAATNLGIAYPAAAFYCPAAAASGITTVTFSTTPTAVNGFVLYIMEITGCGTPTLDNGATPANISNGSGAGTVSTSLTTGTDGCAIVGFGRSVGAVTADTGAGFVEAGNDSNGDVGEFKVQATHGAQSVSFSNSTGAWQVAGIAFKPAGSAGTISRAVALDATCAFSASKSTFATSNLEYHYSGAGSSSNPQNSLGGTISANVITGGLANNVWKDVTSPEAASGKDYYSCLFIKNTNTSLDWQNAVVWIDTQPAQGNIAVGLDGGTIGGTAVSASVDVYTAPSPTITFATPATKAAGLLIGTIPPNQYKAIWLKRHLPAGSSADAEDDASIRIEGEAII